MPRHRVQRDLELSLRRKPVGEQVFFVLGLGGRFTIREIADLTGIRPYRVFGILEGDGEEYAYDLSLVEQGVAARVLDGWARSYELTEKGWEKHEGAKARLRRVVPEGSDALTGVPAPCSPA